MFFSADDDRADSRREYASYYDDPSRGRLVDEPARVRADDIRGRTIEERGRDQYARGYDRYGYGYGNLIFRSIYYIVSV